MKFGADPKVDWVKGRCVCIYRTGCHVPPVELTLLLLLLLVVFFILFRILLVIVAMIVMVAARRYFCFWERWDPIPIHSNYHRKSKVSMEDIHIPPMPMPNGTLTLPNHTTTKYY